MPARAARAAETSCSGVAIADRSAPGALLSAEVSMRADGNRDQWSSGVGAYRPVPVRRASAVRSIAAHCRAARRALLESDHEVVNAPRGEIPCIALVADDVAGAS